ncbi:hypothetical protein [Amnibacterium kyonggiense]|uniref:Uncharacterized protein n=1 Tax=Amnibacterium kyonggiense TaxID=595671 RepID=A0A4R7FPV5_9MICO|nr:hypothetical protein [Amnibacterium kyonggiense]TDS79706.1 hypothetical protein CLV52_0243 [Amnibacterium kyonggiense]
METHAGAAAVERDHVRDATIAQFGTPPLRFTQNQAIRATTWVVDVLERVWLRGSAETARHAARRPAERGVSAEKCGSATELRIREGQPA